MKMYYFYYPGNVRSHTFKALLKPFIKDGLRCIDCRSPENAALTRKYKVHYAPALVVDEGDKHRIYYGDEIHNFLQPKIAGGVR